jgi:hypothetical protein
MYPSRSIDRFTPAAFHDKRNPIAQGGRLFNPPDERLPWEPAVDLVL